MTTRHGDGSVPLLLLAFCPVVCLSAPSLPYNRPTSAPSTFPIKAAMNRIFITLFLFVSPLFAQSNTGELRLKVTDPAGLGVKSSVELVSEANHYRRSFLTDDAGELLVKRL